MLYDMHKTGTEISNLRVGDRESTWVGIRRETEEIVAHKRQG